MRLFATGAFLIMSAAFNVSAQEEQPLNVAEWNAAIEILQNARVLIEEGGWYQGEEVEGAECVSTALERSWTASNRSLVDFNYARMAMDDAISAPELQTLSLASDPLSTPYWGRYYMYWNDAAGRTEEEVLAAFDRAIGFAESQEAASEEAGLTGDDLVRFDANMMRVLGFIEEQ